jgi:tetratricopeptide (TPR) repeat protein
MRDIDDLLDEVDEITAREELLNARAYLVVLRGEEASQAMAELRAVSEELGADEIRAGAEVLRAEYLLRQGRPGEALSVAREALPGLGQNVEIGRWAMLVAGVQLRDLDIVREAEALLRDDANISNAYVATRAAAAGILAALEGRTDEAITGFREGVARFTMAGWHYHTARVQTLALSLMPGEPAFTGWADEARARFERLGAAPDLRQLDEALALVPASTPATSRSEVAGGR